ncbi:hypothetical protein Golomagni_04376 [Golovinomyces magnicellulatus]|nr:hypothetical protein Golomagni_04376 [Golovinomyces magnicellulatus]
MALDMRSLISVLLTAYVLFGPVLGHNINLQAHGRECFHEVLHKEDKMTVTFQVGDREFGGAGSLHIDFWIENPVGGFVTQQKAVANGDFSFQAENDGRYTYCFSNEHWSAASKDVSFNVHGIVYIPEPESPSDPLEAEGMRKPNYLVHIFRDLRNLVRQLSELLAQVKDEQSYIVLRERIHRNTAESTNARVKWWSIFQMAVLIGEGIFQVWWLKRFFEVGPKILYPLHMKFRI